MSRASELADKLRRTLRFAPAWWPDDGQQAADELERLERVNAELVADAARWRRLVNCSEMPFPIATVCNDPENDMRMVYGRQRLEDLIDNFDEIPSDYAAITSTTKEAP